FLRLLAQLRADDRILAYHDVGDGGLFVTLCEMAFASRCGIAATLASAADDALADLFAEELGAVIQVRAADVDAVLAQARALDVAATVIGRPGGDRIRIDGPRGVLLDEPRADL